MEVLGKYTPIILIALAVWVVTIFVREHFDHPQPRKLEVSNYEQH